MTMFPGPVSKAQNVLCVSSCGQHGDVGNAADIQQHTMYVAQLKQSMVEHRDQGRTLSTRSKVSRAKVTDHRDPETLGNHCSFADLQGAT